LERKKYIETVKEREGGRGRQIIRGWVIKENGK
jgi:hypothetical protein